VVVKTPGESIEHPHCEMVEVHLLKPIALPSLATKKMMQAAARIILQFAESFKSSSLPRIAGAPDPHCSSARPLMAKILSFVRCPLMTAAQSCDFSIVGKYQNDLCDSEKKPRPDQSGYCKKITLQP
jgi:hypothetical protein